MGEIAPKGFISLIPVILTLALAFKTRDAVFSLIIGCIVGVVIAGFDPATGLSKLFQASLGNGDFIWVLMIEVAVGIMIAFYLRANVISGFAEWGSGKIRSNFDLTGNQISQKQLFFALNTTPSFSIRKKMPGTFRGKL